MIDRYQPRYPKALERARAADRRTVATVLAGGIAGTLTGVLALAFSLSPLVAGLGAVVISALTALFVTRCYFWRQI